MEAQQSTVQKFLKPGDAIVKEYIEVEAGKKDNRAELHTAIEHAKRVKGSCSSPSWTASAATPASSSRSATAACTLSARTCRRPTCSAQHEQEVINSRTNAPLQVKKQQGFTLGKPDNLTLQARKKGGLQCLVAFELKADELKPEHLGQLNSYLEALDRNVKKTKENPGIGSCSLKTRVLKLWSTL